MVRIFAYILTILLFIGPSILHSLDFPVEGLQNSRYFYPGFYLIIPAIVYVYWKQDTTFMKYPDKQIGLLLIFVFLSCLIFYEKKTLLINSIALPTLYGLFFVNMSLADMKNMRKIVLVMFIVNCTLAICERLFMHNLFPMSSVYKYMAFSQTDLGLFRSSALLGHPLSNALITSIIMGFIMVSSIGNTLKYGLLLLGFFALVCFNARGAVIITGISTFVYFLWRLFTLQESFKSKLLGILFIATCVVFMAMLLSNGFGGRFFEYAVREDDSILARIKVWNILKKMSLDSWLFGMDDVRAYAMKTIGSFHIENWLIIYVMNFGIIVTAMYITLFIPIFRYFMRPYTKFHSLMVFGIFICVASTNNSLATNVPAISMFFVCSRAFLPMVNGTQYANLIETLMIQTK